MTVILRAKENGVDLEYSPSGIPSANKVVHDDDDGGRSCLLPHPSEILPMATPIAMPILATKDDKTKKKNQDEPRPAPIGMKGGCLILLLVLFTVGAGIVLYEKHFRSKKEAVANPSLEADKPPIVEEKEEKDKNSYNVNDNDNNDDDENDAKKKMALRYRLDHKENYTWHALGDKPLWGQLPRAFLDASIAMSRDGTSLVVSSKYFSPALLFSKNSNNDKDDDISSLTSNTAATRRPPTSFPGLVQVFRYETNDNQGHWRQLGADIIGSQPRECRGYTVAISKDGGRIATGSCLESEYGGGSVQVYQFESSRGGHWRLLGGGSMELSQYHDASLSNGGAGGGGIFGSNNKIYGLVVAMSDNGDTVAVGSDRLEEEENPQPVRIFSYNEKTDRFSLQGTILVQNDFEDDKGDTVGDPSSQQQEEQQPQWVETRGQRRHLSLSADGRTIAIASSSSKARVQVFHYRVGKNPAWIRVGSPLDAPPTATFWGHCVSLSGDATRLAISYRHNDTSADAAAVIVYQAQTNPQQDAVKENSQDAHLDDTATTTTTTSWVPMGQVLPGWCDDIAKGGTTMSVALSYSGDSLVVGGGATTSDKNDPGTTREAIQSRVQTFRWQEAPAATLEQAAAMARSSSTSSNQGEWIPMGGDNKEKDNGVHQQIMNGDVSVSAVSISGTGNRIAFGGDNDIFAHWDRHDEGQATASTPHWTTDKSRRGQVHILEYGAAPEPPDA